MDKKVSKSEIAVENEKKDGGGFSRRDFLKSLAATGAGIAFFSSGVKLAKAVGLEREVYWAGELSKEQLLDMYDKMLKIRWFDRTVIDLMQTKKGFRGYAHAYCGEEAVSVGACSALTKDDWMIGYHRSHGHGIAKGADVKKMVAEIIFKAAGTNKGYGGSMHIMQKDVGMMGEDGVVGPGAAMAAGAAAALKARGKGQVALCFGGDAHATTPYFHIALNESATHRLPFIYVIENNQYLDARGQHISECINVRDIADMAAAYNIPGHVVDGQDVLEVYNATKGAVDRAQAGDGPTLIEAKTYRYYDHFGARGAKPGVMGAFGLGYRSDREVRSWMARDPIVKHRRTLISWGMLTEVEADEFEAKVKKEIEEAFEWADKQPVPKAEDGVKNVFVEGTVLPRQLADCPLW